MGFCRVKLYDNQDVYDCWPVVILEGPFQYEGIGFGMNLFPSDFEWKWPEIAGGVKSLLAFSQVVVTWLIISMNKMAELPTSRRRKAASSGSNIHWRVVENCLIQLIDLSCRLWMLLHSRGAYSNA